MPLFHAVTLCKSPLGSMRLQVCHAPGRQYIPHPSEPVHGESSGLLSANSETCHINKYVTAGSHEFFGRRGDENQMPAPNMILVRSKPHGMPSHDPEIRDLPLPSSRSHASGRLRCDGIR